MPSRMAVLAALMLAPTIALAAEPERGVYLGGSLGLNAALPDSDITLSLPGDSRSSNKGHATFESGFSASLRVGYDFGNGLRAELEGSYRRHEVSSVTGFGLPDSAVRASGGPFSFGVMLNGYYDFRLGWPVEPFVGLGLGALMTNWDDVRQTLRSDPNAYTHIVGTNIVPAYQVTLGVALPVGDLAPGYAVTFEYRFVGELDGDRDVFRYTPGSPRLVGSGTTGGSFDQSLRLGLRYTFADRPAPPPPPVVPAVAPAPARSFLVFFDFDRADLTDRARQIIAEAATASQRGGTTRIEVAGHADRSGSPQYNQRLSDRRAAAVAAELERRGVPRTAMAIQAFGESRPLVATADGVREPQNRRVEIVLR